MTAGHVKRRHMARRRASRESIPATPASLDGRPHGEACEAKEVYTGGCSQQLPTWKRGCHAMRPCARMEWRSARPTAWVAFDLTAGGCARLQCSRGPEEPFPLAPFEPVECKARHPTLSRSGCCPPTHPCSDDTDGHTDGAVVDITRLEGFLNRPGRHLAHAVECGKMKKSKTRFRKRLESRPGFRSAKPRHWSTPPIRRRDPKKSNAAFPQVFLGQMKVIMTPVRLPVWTT
jgi:hypothetical protein